MESKMTKTINLQDMFLNQARKANTVLTIYLNNGIQLKGQVKGFDSFTMLLDSPGKPTQLIYKHAISSILPAKGFTMDRDPKHFQSLEDTDHENESGKATVMMNI